MQTDRQTDILIVGGGLVGVSLACALKDLPISVTLLDATPPMKKNVQADFDSRSIVLSYASYRMLQTMGLWAPILPYATPVNHIHVSSQGHGGITRFSAKETGIEALGYVIEAHALATCLSNAVRLQNNLTYLQGISLTQLSRCQETMHATLHSSRGELCYRASLVIAADGTHSTVRTLLNIPTIKKNHHEHAIAANVGLARSHQQRAFERFTQQGPLAMLPLTDERAALIWSLSPSRANALMSCDESTFLRELQRDFGYRLGRFVKVGQRVSYPVQQVIAKTTVLPGVVLVGNAAQTLHPIAGQGFNLGLRDVASLVQVIADACAMSQSLHHTQLLTEHSRWRKWDKWRTTWLTNGLHQIFSTHFFPYTTIRSLAMVAMDMTWPVKQVLGRQAMGMTGKLPHLMCGLPVQGMKDHYA